jgi:molecular chaperone GrpE (heat shock protein)
MSTLNEAMADFIGFMQKYSDPDEFFKLSDEQLTEAHKAVQEDLAKDLVKAIIDTVERNIDVVYDENEDGKFTYAELGSSLEEQLLEDIAEYILERR